MPVVPPPKPVVRPVYLAEIEQGIAALEREIGEPSIATRTWQYRGLYRLIHTTLCMADGPQWVINRRAAYPDFWDRRDEKLKFLAGAGRASLCEVSHPRPV